MRPSRLPHASPALVTQKAAQRLPRLALLLFCAAYLLPGLLGRDPWKNEDIAAFGQMWSLALGQASWFDPHVGGVHTTQGGILPYWIGGGALPRLQLTGAALLLFGMAAAQQRSPTTIAATTLALPVLAGSGSPTVALLLGCAAPP